MKWMAIIDVVLILAEVVQYAQGGFWIFALAPLASFINYFIVRMADSTMPLR